MAGPVAANCGGSAPVAGSADRHDDHGDETGGHDADAPPPGFVIDPALATSLGLDEETRRALLGSFGFRSVGDPLLQRWRWSGLKNHERRGKRKPRIAIRVAIRGFP